MGLVTTSLRTSRAARVRGRALQRGRRRRAATTTTRFTMKAAMTGTGGAGDGRNGRRGGILDKPPDDLRGEGRDAKTTSGALARRGCVGFGGCSDARPPTMQKTTGGAATSPVKDMLAGLGVAAAIHVKTTGGALARRSGQYEGIGNPTAQPQQMASASTRASATLQLSHSGWHRPQCGPVRGHRFALGSQRSMPRWHGATVRKIGRSQ